MHQLRLFLVAVQFLTRLPVPDFRTFDPAWLQACARWFPAVGLLLGALVALTLAAGAAVWPPALAAAVALAVGVALTGAFHEDGLADTWDALGGVVPRARALEIMKDSRLGSYGALALLLSLPIKALALGAVAARDLPVALAALPLVHAWARLGPVALIAALPYGGDLAHAKAKPLATHAGPGVVSIAFGTCLIASGAALLAGLLSADAVLRIAVATAAATLLTGAWLRRRLGGTTGDGLGATEQHAELLAWLALAATPTP
jgi:adenosylcobinamide-GDP ribazoletransferase